MTTYSSIDLNSNSLDYYSYNYNIGFGMIDILIPVIIIFTLCMAVIKLVGSISGVNGRLFGDESEEEPEKELPKLTRFEEYYIEKKDEELDREELFLDLKERELDLKKRKRKYVQQWGDYKNGLD